VTELVSNLYEAWEHVVVGSTVSGTVRLGSHLKSGTEISAIVTWAALGLLLALGLNLGLGSTAEVATWLGTALWLLARPGTLWSRASRLAVWLSWSAHSLALGWLAYILTHWAATSSTVLAAAADFTLWLLTLDIAVGSSELGASQFTLWLLTLRRAVSRASWVITVPLALWMTSSIGRSSLKEAFSLDKSHVRRGLDTSNSCHQSNKKNSSSYKLHIVVQIKMLCKSKYNETHKHATSY
jgi:hypothetical protein